jgi:PAS domain S-box-containing protein
MSARAGSLRGKMALLLVAASAVPVALATAIELRAARALIREQAVALLSARTEALAGQIDMFHREYQKISVRLASLPTIRDFVAAPPAARPVADLVGGLRGYTDHDPNFRGLGIFDATGTVIAATETPLMAQNYGFRPYFRHAMGGDATTSEIYIAVPEVDSVPSIAYAAPVKSAGGEVIGVVALWVRAEPFWRLVGESNDKAGAGSYSLLLDRYGVRIAHSASADLLFRPTGPLDPAALADLEGERRFGNRTRVLLQAPAPFPDAFARSQSAALDTDVFRATNPATGDGSLAVARRLETVPWTLFYLVPERSLDAPVVALVRRVAAASAGVILAALAVGLVFAGRIARSLSASEARFRALSDNANDAIVSADARGLITYANPSVERLFGRAPGELLGQPVTLIMPERFREAHETGLRRYLETREPHIIGRTVELVGLARDGREFPVDMSLATWTDGGAPAFTAVLRDISERRRAEEDLRRGRRELEAAAAQLAAANRELESFSYSVSHDLRAPLRHIAGFVDLLRRHAAASLDDTGRRYLETISSSAVRMGQLIDDLLSFSRMGRGELTRTRIDLDAMVREVARLAVQEEPSREIALAIGAMPPVIGDASMLRVAFTNLLQNAVKYTRRREGAEIEVGALPASDGQATVYVRDNGAGFDMQYAGKLFGVFQRLHPAHEFEGTGIGLATVRRIVERHGGRAWAEGRPGEGATFYVTLPAAGPR